MQEPTLKPTCRDDVGNPLQVVKTQSMRASPYIRPFEERVKAWEAKLVLTQDTMDAWLQCQQVRGWGFDVIVFPAGAFMFAKGTQRRLV